MTAVDVRAGRWGGASEVPREIGIRWTIGDVSRRGWEALRLSAWGAWRIFGPRAAYAVCVNTVPVRAARERAGDLPPGVGWIESRGRGADVLRTRLDPSADGAGWRLDPPRVFPSRWEIALDNDVVLWEMPPTLAAWLDAGDPARCLAGEDVAARYGGFAAQAGGRALNGGIRGFPPGFDYAGALRTVLADAPSPVASEADERGLQVAALRLAGEPAVVPLAEVSLCAPFAPHLPHLGRCGAHFVGQNARGVPGGAFDHPAVDAAREHWRRHRRVLYERVGLPIPADVPAPVVAV